MVQIFSPSRQADAFRSRFFEMESGWQRIFRRAFLGYPISAIVIFLAGTMASLFELAAFAIIFIGVQVFATSEPVDLYLLTVPGELSTAHVLGGIAAFALLMLCASVCFYSMLLYIARYRRVTFKNILSETVTSMRRNPEHPFIAYFGPKGLPRVLRRESRYVSRSITDALQLPRPLLILSALSIAGLVFFPIPVLVALAVLAISLPVHLMVARWGAKAMDTMIDTGGKKSAEDKSIVASLVYSPFRHDRTHMKKLTENYLESDKVNTFLYAYERRSKLTPTSQFVSRLTFLIILICVSVTLYLQYENGAVNLSEITAFIIGTRFVSANFAATAQIVTNIASFSPLISRLLDFLNSPDLKLQQLDIEKLEGRDLPSRICLIGREEPSWGLVNKLSEALDGGASHMQIIHNRSQKLPADHDLEGIHEALEGPWAKLSDPLKDRVRNAVIAPGNASRDAFELLLLWVASETKPGCGLFWEGGGFLAFTIPDRAVLLEWLGDRRLIAYFHSVPKRLPPLPDAEVWLLQSNTLVFMGSARDFLSQRDQIVQIHREGTIEIGVEEIDDEFSFGTV